MFNRLFNSLKVWFVAWKNPAIFNNNNNLKMIVDLYAFIVKVAEEEKPYMKQGALILHQKGDKKVIISIWAGAGIGANPTSRIEELNKKIEDLERVNNEQNNMIEMLGMQQILEMQQMQRMQQLGQMQQIEQCHKYQEYLKLKKEFEVQ